MWKELGKPVECISCFRADIRFSLVYLMFKDLHPCVRYVACQCVYVLLYAVFVFSFVGRVSSMIDITCFSNPIFCLFSYINHFITFPHSIPASVLASHDDTDTDTNFSSPSG